MLAMMMMVVSKAPPISAPGRQPMRQSHSVGGRPLAGGMTRTGNRSHLVRNEGKADRYTCGRRDDTRGRSGTAMADTQPGGFTDSERTASAYAKHYDLLSYVARTRFRIPDADVRAIVHDVFLSFMQNDGKIVRSDVDERSWLIGATCNACRYYWRKNRCESPPVDLEQRVDPTVVADEAHARVTVARILRSISARCREVLRRRYSEGYEPDEIARKEAVTRGSAKNLISKCLNAARQAYRDLGRL